MESVKALINLNDGTIQLEGPQEFVEKYLDKYSSVIDKWQKTPSDPVDIPNVNKDEKKREEIKRTRVSGRSGCSDKIRVIAEENYFIEPKTINDIVSWLKDQKSSTYKPNQVSAALSYFIKSGTLKIRRFKEAGVYKYCNI